MSVKKMLYTRSSRRKRRSSRRRRRSSRRKRRSSKKRRSSRRKRRSSRKRRRSSRKRRRRSRSKKRRSRKKSSRRRSRKSGQTLRPLTAIKVVTINAFLQAELEPFYNQLMRQLQGVDVVCIQEAPPDWAIKDSILNEYYKVACESQIKDRGNERMTTLLLRTSPWKFTDCTEFRTELCGTPRVSQLVTFTRGVIKIRIGNLHLCGGKYDEETIWESSVKELKTIKQETVTQLSDADIILGDFNSVRNPLAKSGYVEYMKDLGWNNAKIVAWNMSPFQKLTSMGYKRVNYNEPTSTFGETPDSIWYKGMRPLSITGIDMGAQDMIASDHNGICVEFRLN